MSEVVTMEHKRSPKTKQLWHSFFNHEQHLLNWANNNTTVLYSIEPKELLMYRPFLDDEQLTKPPKHIRHICCLNSSVDPEEFEVLFSELKEMYRKALIEQAIADNKELSIKFPNRFPIFRHNIQQVNISVNEAFSSKNKLLADVNDEQTISLSSVLVIEPKDLDFMKNEMNGQVEILQRFGLRSAKIMETTDSKVISLTLDINLKELFSLAKAESLQFREATGAQYRARLFTSNNETPPERVRFGFIILNDNAQINHVLPQPPRPHSLKNSGNRFELPISTAIEIYIKQIVTV